MGIDVGGAKHLGVCAKGTKLIFRWRDHVLQAKKLQKFSVNRKLKYVISQWVFNIYV